MAEEGAALAHHLIASAKYLATARRAIPAGFDVANQTPHPHFLTGDFAWVRSGDGKLAPKLVEIQAFPSVFAYQVELSRLTAKYSGCRNRWVSFSAELRREFLLGAFPPHRPWQHDPENVVLTEVDPLHQKTFPISTSRADGSASRSSTSPRSSRLGTSSTTAIAAGRLMPIDRIYNRAIADELIARGISAFRSISRIPGTWSGRDIPTGIS